MILKVVHLYLKNYDLVTNGQQVLISTSRLTTGLPEDDVRS